MGTSLHTTGLVCSMISNKRLPREKFVALVQSLGFTEAEVYSLTFYQSGIVEVTTLEDLSDMIDRAAGRYE